MTASVLAVEHTTINGKAFSKCLVSLDNNALGIAWVQDEISVGDTLSVVVSADANLKFRVRFMK